MATEGLPAHRPARRADLVRFDLVAGLPASLGVLRRHLGPLAVLRVLVRYMAFSLRDPLRDVAPSDWSPRDEALARHQFRAVMRLDDALRSVVSDDAERIEVLGAVVAETGSRFLARMLDLPDLDAWLEADDRERQAFLEGATGRFFNARVDALHVADDGLGFDVGACRFVELAQAVDRPYLAPLFCEADSVYFEDESSPVRLERTGTIARGASCCDFRFRHRPRQLAITCDTG